MASKSEIRNTVLAVNTEKLKSDADTAISDLNSILKTVGEMYDEVSALNGMWKGKANDAFNDQFHNDYEEVKSYIDELLGVINQIKDKSREYEVCENDVTSFVSGINI